MKISSHAWLAMSSETFLATAVWPPEKNFPLSPPEAELPPGWKEQYGPWLAALAVLLIAAAVVLAWRRKRHKPPVEPVEARTRRELASLCRQPENGRNLSLTSRYLRQYLAAAFQLPPEEMTTAEFCRVLEINAALGPELAGATAAFLRQCDHRKFALTPPPPFDAAVRALELVALAERRREQLRQDLAPRSNPAPLSAS